MTDRQSEPPAVASVSAEVYGGTDTTADGNCDTDDLVWCVKAPGDGGKPQEEMLIPCFTEHQVNIPFSCIFQTLSVSKGRYGEQINAPSFCFIFELLISLTEPGFPLLV